MHIAYLTTEYPHKKLPPAGGIGTFIGNMSREFIKDGHKVTIFICLSDRDCRWIDDEVQIIQIARSTGKIIPEFVASRLKIHKVVNKIITEQQINVIESPDWEGLQAFCTFKIPLITRTHGSVTYFSNLANKPVSRTIHFLEKRGLKKSNYIVGVTKYAAKKTKELFNLKSQEIPVIYYGTDLKKFKPLPQDQIVSPPILLHFGTLVRKKGVLDIPHIFNQVYKKHPNIQLVILGKDTIDTNENKSTWSLMQKSFTSKSLSNVKYYGPVSLDSVKKYLSKATACIFTSYAETFGLVTTEAMAMAKPVIVYDLPWVREIIDHEVNGILIQPGDFVECASRISKVIKNQEIIQNIGLEARNKVERFFDLRTIYRENLALYNEVVYDQ